MARSVFTQRPVWIRVLARILVVGQVWAAIPIAHAEEAPISAEAPTVEAQPEAPPVKVNRTPPAPQALPATPQFSRPPTDAELARVHVFEEPLIPIGRATTPAENAALALAITTYINAGGGEDLSLFEQYLATNPETPWRAALLTGLGIVYRRTGYFSRALTAWESAWTAARGATDPMGSAIADRAVAELAELSARLGRPDRLEALFADIGSRDVRGSAAEKVSQAREGLAKMRETPGEAFRCGPMALDRIMAYGNASYRPDMRVVEAQSTPRGTSLVQVQSLAQTVGLQLQMAFRSPSAPPGVPSVVHWKSGHFAALVAQRDGRYLIQDPTFGHELWVSRRALDDEASGYALIPAGALLAGWRAVDADEGGQVWGKGFTSSNNPQNQSCQDPRRGGRSCPANSTCLGMAEYQVHAMIVALNINDQPVGYTPPRGPAVGFQASYHQREIFQPQIPPFGNLGPKWTYDWLSFLEDDPANLSAAVNVYLRLGGQETYGNFNSSTQSYAPHSRSRAVVVRTSTSPITYERRLSDGSKEVFARSDGSPSVPRKVYLTSWSDPQGNTVSLTYNGLKLVSVTDAIGQVTTLSYELPGDPLKITKVTDPFGRFATFQYNGLGQLWKITDVIGIVSEFAYGTGDFITSLTTPYGMTRFATGTGSDQKRWVEATDPLGAVERVEFRHNAPGISASDPANTVPTGVLTGNQYLHAHNTYFWDKRASALDPWHNDYTKATISHWNRDVDIYVASGIIESEKRPLENRVWYSYPGQTNASIVSDFTAGPATVARVLDDGSTQVYRYEYNAKGKKIKETDPVGRETVYVYGIGSTPDPNPATGTGIDLLQVKQKNGGSYDLIQSYTYNAQHEPLTRTDASGQVTTFTYNGQGQLATGTTPPRAGISENRTTTYTYDPGGSGQLQSVAGPATGATTSYTYDGYGRVRTVTDADGYALTYDYDNLDRTTKVTYPDGTYEQLVYNRLDPQARRDRLGRWSHTLYDALRRVVSTRDPAGRTTTQRWCTCGSLEKVVDANGNAITWERDVQGRATREIRADNSVWEYTYETTTSRLKQVKDARNQITGSEYFADDNLKQVTYTNALVATPNVSLSYDPVYNRPATMTDGTGTATTSYNPIGVPSTLGAGRVASVDGPLSNDTVNYAYDELGRVVSAGVSGFVSSYSYDALGRIASQSTPAGTFTFAYVGVTARPSTLTYPNNQATQYAYFPNSGDRRLQEIKHLAPGGAVLSKYNYTYDVQSNAKTWTQQVGASAAKVYELGYDRADQLKTATLKTTDPTPVVLKRYGYDYDVTGNRTTEQVDDGVFSGTYNNRNQLSSRQAGGALLFRGMVNEAATVTVGAKPAQVAPDNRFEGTAQVAAGTNTVEVKATDSSGNLRTNTYQVGVSGAPTSYTYDANGNLIGDGTRTFEYDAENRLTRVLNGASEVARFIYDGQSRRAQKIAGGVTTSYVYDFASVLEERLSTGTTLRYIHGWGIDQHFAVQDQGGAVSYFLADHLGSVVQTTNAAGQVTLSREYDPFGNVLTGATQGGYAYAGREWDPETGLLYLRARYYEPKLGRFISEDPIGFAGGGNFYGYVGNNPLNLTDPTGLCACSPGNKKCVGKARVLQGNSRHIGRQGGIPGVNVAAGSAAVIPGQFGLRNGNSLKPFASQMTGVVLGTPFPIPLFDCVTEVVGPRSARQNLQQRFPNTVIIELPSGGDMGIIDIEITIPNELPCPPGTMPSTGNACSLSPPNSCPAGGL